MRIITIVALYLSAGVLVAGDTRMPFELEDGQKSFLANCAVCHGADGNSVVGIDLIHGKLRRATSDDAMVKIIRDGIPGTSMPPNRDFSKYEATCIVNYLRWLGSTETNSIELGDAARGKAIFEGNGRCLECHRVLDRGSCYGPDLTAIGTIRRAAKLRQSLVEPGSEVLPQNRSVRLVTRDGQTINGRLLNHDTFTVQLIDSRNQLRSFLRSNLKEFEILTRSVMPSYREKLSETDVADLIGYLVSLKGSDKQ
jgi:putative heme-binding domain-containing protein